MLEKYCDLWKEPADARCITTNGFIKKNGELVMGAGVAGQAQKRWPFLPYKIGQTVKECGNHVFTYNLTEDYKPITWLIVFPVKHVWYEKADLSLIKRSAEELMDTLDKPEFSHWTKVLLPRPGCGNGQLKWEQVKPVIETVLDDRVVVVDNGIPEFYVRRD